MSDSTVARRLSYVDAQWIAAALTLAVLPHTGRMPWWVAALAASFAAWQLRSARVRLNPPARSIMAALVIASTAAVYLEFGTIFGRDPGISLLILMLSLKLMEMSTAREAAMLLALAFFVILTHLLFSQTILTALYLLVCVWLITAAMTRLQQRPAEVDQKAALRTAGLLLAQSVPLMLVLFLFFPRVQGPFWRTPADAHAGLSGLSDSMTPGSLSNMILSEDVAFRAQFRNELPPQEKLYWRGPVLTQFDGRTWRSTWNREDTEIRYLAVGAALDYEVTVEPHNKRWLFALDVPARVPPNASATTDLQLLARGPVVSRVRYEMTSYLDYRMHGDETPHALKRALQLPAGANPRTAELARELRSRHADDKALIDAVLRRLRRENYVYTLAPPALHEHPVDAFLFDTRQGFCEHYSSAFVVIMRAAGIPARVVTGYQGGEPNPVGGYLIVRQADAHAWAEVWLRDSGWVRVDPTAAVAPERVQRGIVGAVDGLSGLPLFARSDFALLRQLTLGWDAAAYQWNQWVLGYTVERQRYVASQLGLGASWRGLAMTLAAAAGIVTLALALAMLVKRRAPQRDPVQRAYIAFCAVLARHGLPRAAHEGPSDFGNRVVAARPDLARETLGVVRLYCELRYGRQRSNEAVRRLSDAVKRLRSALSRGRAAV